MFNANAEREKFLKFSIPVMNSNDLIWYKKGNKKIKEWRTFKDLKNYTIGISSGFNYGDDYNKAVVKYNLKTDKARTDLQNFKEMALNRTDIFICNETAAKSIFRKNPELKNKFKSMKKPLKKVILHIALSKKSKHVKLMKKINIELRKMKKDGTIRRILRKY